MRCEDYTKFFWHYVSFSGIDTNTLKSQFRKKFKLFNKPLSGDFINPLMGLFFYAHTNMEEEYIGEC